MTAFDTPTAGNRGEATVASQMPEPTRQYLYGVQGLRTLAALMVAVYHIWFQRVSGGVDVFFVVAGYFAAGSMLKATSLERPQERIRAVFQYWLRTARRVVPSAVVVIVGTVVAGMALLPGSQWATTVNHGIASLAFLENWYLIRVGDNYLQQGFAATAFQQFWALSIQVQSYFVFPLIALAAAFLTRRTGRGGRWMLFWAAAVVLLVSLVYSIRLTAVNQPAAYFHLGARMWEFMAGVVLALLLTKPVLGPGVARLLGWCGLAVIVLFAAVADLSMLLPGHIALVPVLGAAAVITSSRHGGEPAILKSRPMLWFADSSFAFYLWHWPLFVFYKWRIAQEVSLVGGLGILVIAAALAIATTKLIENPIRRSKRLMTSWVATVVVIATLLAIAGASLAMWHRMLMREGEKARQQVDTALSTGRSAGGYGFVPSTLIVADDNSEAYRNGCHQDQFNPEVIICIWGDETADTTVAIVGASHDTQWIDSLAALGKAQGFRLVSMTKSACSFGEMAQADYEVTDSCIQWADDVLNRLLASPPALVVTTATRVGEDGESVPGWKRTYFEALSEAGTPVLGVRDNPWFGFVVPDCVDMLGADACAVPRRDVLNPLDELGVPNLPHFTFLDTADDYCSAELCPAVSEGVLIYRDTNHLTTTWTMLHGDRLGDAIMRLLD